jgi:hypothetical protein
MCDLNTTLAPIGATREGLPESPWEHLIGGVVLGTEAFAERLRELAERMGGLDYTAAGAAVSRFGRRLGKDRKLARALAPAESQLSNDVEM